MKNYVYLYIYGYSAYCQMFLKGKQQKLKKLLFLAFGRQNITYKIKIKTILPFFKVNNNEIIIIFIFYFGEFIVLTLYVIFYETFIKQKRLQCF